MELSILSMIFLDLIYLYFKKVKEKKNQPYVFFIKHNESNRFYLIYFLKILSNLSLSLSLIKIFLKYSFQA